MKWRKKIVYHQIRYMAARLSIGSWGPAAWTIMHATSFAYPVHPEAHDRERMYEFLVSLAAVLPCRKCRVDWQKYLQTHLISPDSPHLSGRGPISRFLVAGHNHVNAKLGKRLVAYDTVAKWYLQDDAGYGRLWGIAGFVLVVVLAASICVRHRLRHRTKS